MRYFIFLCFVLGFLTTTVSGQNRTTEKLLGNTIQGIVWQQPTGFEDAYSDLVLMDSIGVEAIRTGIISDERLLTLADSLELAFYQELPFYYTPAGRLESIKDSVITILTAALKLAQIHPSARHFGLTTNAGTSNEKAIEWYQEVTSFFRENAPAGGKIYYITPFIENDVSFKEVDFVLLNTRDGQPVDLLNKWRQINDTPAGLATIGVPVTKNSRSGYQNIGSLDYQARYLENVFNDLIGMQTTADEAIPVFVARWRDVRTEKLQLTSSFENLRVNSFGLQTVNNQKRPAFDVFAGFYSNKQNKFAISAGVAPERTSWSAFIGWTLVVLLLLLYSIQPLLRPLIRRYFNGHRFYCDAIRRNRDIQFSTIVIIILLSGTAAGLTTTTLANLLKSSYFFELLAVNDFVVIQYGLIMPLFFAKSSVVIFGLIFIGMRFTESVWGVLVTGRQLRQKQTLALSALAHWPIWIWMIVVLLENTGSAGHSKVFYLILAGATLSYIWAFVRTVRDTFQTARNVSFQSLLLWTVVPAITVLGTIFYLMIIYSPEIAFLWEAVFDI